MRAIRNLSFLLMVCAASMTPASAEDASSHAPDPWLPSSRYYEARVTPEGYTLYIPFFISRAWESNGLEPGGPFLSIDDTSTSMTFAPLNGPGFSRVRTREEIVPGEVIEVYRPAVYEVDVLGRERLIAPQEILVLPKIRIILERVPLERSAPSRPVNRDEGLIPVSEEGQHPVGEVPSDAGSRNR